VDAQLLCPGNNIRSGRFLWPPTGHPELPGVASLRQTQTNPRIHGWDIVSRTNTTSLAATMVRWFEGGQGLNTELVYFGIKGLNTELVYFGIKKYQLKKRKWLILKNTSKINYT
jgi:hypothetical protein